MNQNERQKGNKLIAKILFLCSPRLPYWINSIKESKHHRDPHNLQLPYTYQSTLIKHKKNTKNKYSKLIKTVSERK